MNRLLAILLLAAPLCGMSSTITNYVYVVSNVYNYVYTENVITQRVKNTHTNYYITNNVTTVNRNYNTTFKTNVSVNCDLSDSYVRAASNEANRASECLSSARTFANSASSSSTAAARSESVAESAASSAANSRSRAEAECNQAISTINARINWFDQHSGETITNVNINTNIVITVNAQDYSYVYTNVEGTAFDYVTVHPYGANGGVTVSPRSSTEYSTVSIRVWPRPRNTSNSSKYWIFYPGYVDYDDKGMRLQYLPDTSNPIYYLDGNSAYPNGKIIPEYFYWQSGYVYFKVRVWQNGAVVAWCITKYKWDNWPNTIGYGGDTGTAMTLVSRYLYGDDSMGSTLAYLYSNTRTEEKNTGIEFPMNPSASYASTLEWMRNGMTLSVHNSDTLTNSYTYTDNSGNEFPYVKLHENWGVTVLSTSNDVYSTVSINIYPQPRDLSTDNKSWNFYPAYVDYDGNGMRLHYLPEKAVPIKYKDANGAYPNGYIVPEYFYWQSGYVYFKVRVWQNGSVVGWCLSKYKWADWPNTIFYGENQWRGMSLVSRSGYGDCKFIPESTAYIAPAYFKSMTRTADVNTSLEFPANKTKEYYKTLEWMSTGIADADLQDQISSLQLQCATNYTLITSLMNTVSNLSNEVSSILGEQE